MAAALAVSGCGNSAIAPVALLPGASAGFATAASTVQTQNQGVTFLNGPQLIAFAPGSAQLSTADVRVSNAVANDGQIEVTINGTAFVATETKDASGNVTSYDGVSGGQTLRLQPMATETSS